MAITDVNSTQYLSLALATTAKGFRAPSGTVALLIKRGDVDVRVQVADESANVAEQDLDEADIASPVQADAVSASGAAFPADAWHVVSLSPTDAPDIGTPPRRPVVYLQAAEPFTADTENCMVRFVRTLL